MDRPDGVIPDENDINSIQLKSFVTFMSRQMLRANVLMTGNAILMGVMVGIGAYGHRYRHHPLTRFFFIGATTLFLPIVSYIVSITGGEFTIAVTRGNGLAIGECESLEHMALVFLWTSFIQIIGINTTAIVAADDREARTIAPPTALLVQAVWVTYLGATLITGLAGYGSRQSYIFSFAPSTLIFIKIFFKYYAWYSARQSFSFGRNPRLVTGYMTENLPTDDGQHASDEIHVPPPLLVSRENTMVVGKNPYGYQIMSSSSSGISTGYRRLSTTTNKRGYLVTIDKVWKLDDRLLKSTAQLKDACLSFALFKMLRCHFARYNVSEGAGFIKAREFLWHFLLEDSDGTRTLGVIATELSFLQDYYYSSLPTSYSKDWLPISSIFLSLGSIGYGLFIAHSLMPAIESLRGSEQISCHVKISTDPSETDHDVSFGNMWYDLIPLALVILLAVLSEVRDIASYVCSDWTKVALMCRYVSWREYPTLRRCIGILLRLRCKLERPLKDNINQCSIIVLHPPKFRIGALLRRIIPLPEPKKSIKLPREVKAAIVNTLRSNSGRGDDLRNGKLCWQQLGIQFGNNFIQARGTQGTSDTLLAWHIATTIFEARNPPSLSSSSSWSIAMHLSRYCAYLLAYSPQLLPDDEKWSENMYKATKKGAESALRDTVPMATPELEYLQLVRLLSPAGSKHDVLNEGARLGEQLVDLMKGEEGAGWKALGGFWCDMILQMAPSDNLNGHAVALAQGGELITILWALLTHVGIPEATVRTTTMGASPDVV